MTEHTDGRSATSTKPGDGNEMKLSERTTADVNFESGDWSVGDMPFADELADAIETARGGEPAIVVPETSQQVLRAVPNEKTGTVWVQVYGYSQGREVKVNDEALEVDQ